MSHHATTLEADMTLGMALPLKILHLVDTYVEVGTRLYIAPEVQSRKRGPRNHNKADMYSLGVSPLLQAFSVTYSERLLDRVL